MGFNWGTALFQSIAVILLIGAIFVFVKMMIGGVRDVNVNGLSKNTYALPAFIIGLALFCGLNAVANSVMQSVNHVSDAVSGRPPYPPQTTYPNLQVSTNDGMVWVVNQATNTVKAYRYDKENNAIVLVATKSLLDDK